MNNINNLSGNFFTSTASSRRKYIEEEETLQETPAPVEEVKEATPQATANKTTVSADTALDTISSLNKANITFSSAVQENRLAAKLEELKSYGLSVDSTDVNTIMNITVSKDATTGLVTVTGMNGTKDNALKAKVDDSVTSLKLNNCSNIDINVNAKTKLSSDTSYTNLGVGFRFDLDTDPSTLTSWLKPAGGSSGYTIYRHMVANNNTETKYSGISADMGNDTYRAEALADRISKLETALGGAPISDSDKATLESTLDYVRVIKDTTTGEFTAVPLNAGTDPTNVNVAKTVKSVQDIISKYGGKAGKILTAETKVADSLKTYDIANHADSSAQSVLKKNQDLLTTAKAPVTEATKSVTDAQANLDKLKAAYKKARGISKIVLAIRVRKATTALATAQAKLKAATSASAGKIKIAEAGYNDAKSKADAAANDKSNAAQALAAAQAELDALKA